VPLIYDKEKISLVRLDAGFVIPAHAAIEAVFSNPDACWRLSSHSVRDGTGFHLAAVPSQARNLSDVECSANKSCNSGLHALDKSAKKQLEG
jgi:hypothetical protein